MKLANNDKFETYFESKKYFENQNKTSSLTRHLIQFCQRGLNSQAFTIYREINTFIVIRILCHLREIE